MDLDIDLVKRPGEDWKLIDYDDFQLNSLRLNYPGHILQFVKDSIKNLEVEIQQFFSIQWIFRFLYKRDCF